MPLNVRRFWTSSLILTAAAAGASVLAQDPQASLNQQPSGTATAVAAANPTNATQQKIARVRALIAARNFVAASNELEKIRKETSDEALQSVARTMLIAVYLEQPDYNRALTLLEDSFKRNKSRKTGVDESYLAVAGQIIKGAQNQLERYKRLSLNATDANLPKEAATDLDRWRAMLETVVSQAKQLSVESKKPAEAFALLEEAANARGSLARDEYEAARWKNEMNDTREMMANAQSKISEVDENLQQTTLVAGAPANQTIAQESAIQNASLTRGETTLNTASVFEQKPAPTAQIASGQSSDVLSQKATTIPEADPPATQKQDNSPAASQPIAEIKTETATAISEPTTGRKRIVVSSAAEKPVDKAKETAVEKTSATAANNNGEMMQVGSLVEMATRKVAPTYPQVAKTARITGLVKVEVVLDEQGEVAEVKNANGPEMLRRAATDAVKRWKFKPAMRDGQPVRASGFVNFNFTL